MLIDNHNGRNIPVFYDQITSEEEYYEFNSSEITFCSVLVKPITLLKFVQFGFVRLTPSQV
jgi:hypothetical protein